MAEIFKNINFHFREGVLEGRDEACLAVLDGLYDDGLAWHDVACHHVKPVICERKKEDSSEVP